MQYARQQLIYEIELTTTTFSNRRRRWINPSEWRASLTLFSLNASERIRTIHEEVRMSSSLLLYLSVSTKISNSNIPFLTAQMCYIETWCFPPPVTSTGVVALKSCRFCTSSQLYGRPAIPLYECFTCLGFTHDEKERLHGFFARPANW